MGFGQGGPCGYCSTTGEEMSKDELVPLSLKVAENPPFLSPQRISDALEVLNRRIAGIYRQEAKRPIFQFVELIDQRVVVNDAGQGVVVREVLGTCNHQTGLIKVVPSKGWQFTVVHELVHLYNPKRREAWIRKGTRDVIRFLKQGAIWDWWDWEAKHEPRHA